MNNILTKKGLKTTKQRQIIIDIINNLDTEATLKNITKKCCNNVDNSTVYRIIETFLEKEIIEKRINYNEEIYYAIKEEHGHYFTCIKCHKKEKIECPLEEIETQFEKEKGYKIINHTILINGLCKNCNK